MATASSPTDSKTPGSWNRYAYVQSDPINFRDRNGQTLESVGDGSGDVLVVVPDNTATAVATTASSAEPVPSDEPVFAPEVSCTQSLGPAWSIGTDAYWMTMRLINENSYWSLWTNSYQNGDKLGHPTGPQITWGTIQNENIAMVSVMFNLVNTPKFRVFHP